MQITGTHINYYFICKRKLWLFCIGIHMEQVSDLVYEGRLIHEYSYPQRSGRYTEIEIEGIKIDYYDSKAGIIHEIKKSDKKVSAHEWQLKYYMYVCENNNIHVTKGILEYPTLRKTEEIFLTGPDREEIQRIMEDIVTITQSEDCPSRLRPSSCRSCSYYDFCWINEEE